MRSSSRQAGSCLAALVALMAQLATRETRPDRPSHPHGLLSQRSPWHRRGMLPKLPLAGSRTLLRPPTARLLCHHRGFYFSSPLSFLQQLPLGSLFCLLYPFLVIAVFFILFCDRCLLYSFFVIAVFSILFRDRCLLPIRSPGTPQPLTSQYPSGRPT